MVPLAPRSDETRLHERNDVGIAAEERCKLVDMAEHGCKRRVFIARLERQSFGEVVGEPRHELDSGSASLGKALLRLLQECVRDRTRLEPVEAEIDVGQRHVGAADGASVAARPGEATLRIRKVPIVGGVGDGPRPRLSYARSTAGWGS